MLTGGKTKGAHPTESTAKLAFFIHTAKYPLHIAPLTSVFSIFPHIRVGITYFFNLLILTVMFFRKNIFNHDTLRLFFVSIDFKTNEISNRF